MARRKVTMLEAFQRSARESAERAASERRRVIAEREKEIRRAGTARTAQEFSSRLSQRAGDSVGSLLAGIRGAPAARLEASATQNDRVEPSASLSVTDAPDIRRVPPVVPPAASSAPQEVAAPKRNGPALPAFDRAVHAELPDVSSTLAGAGHSVSSATVSVPGLGAPGLAASGPGVEVDAKEEAQEDEPLAEASSEEVEEAIAALETEVFELPMSSRTFALLSLAAVVAVFMIGYSFGNRGESSTSPQDGSGFARAGLPLASPGSRPSGSPSGSGGILAGDLYSPGGGSRSHQVSDGGTYSAPNSNAADFDSQATSAERGFTEQGPMAPGLTPEDKTFRNAEMKFTIMAITYSATEAHAKLARETYDYLYSEGFPVIQPIEKDSRLFLFVGASKSIGQLEDLKQELQSLQSGQSRDARPFRTSFVVNIDPYR